MYLYYEIVFWCARALIVLAGIMFVWTVGFLLHERYVRGNVDAFKPERRMGPADRRAGVPPC